jgi:hypothetical protein
MVGYGMRLHSRMQPQCPAENVWIAPGHSWILNTKATWEWELDAARYEYIEGIAAEMGVQL